MENNSLTIFHKQNLQKSNTRCRDTIKKKEKNTVAGTALNANYSEWRHLTNDLCTDYDLDLDSSIYKSQLQFPLLHYSICSTPSSIIKSNSKIFCPD